MSTLIQGIMPEAHFVGRVSTPVHAPPVQVLRALRDVTLEEMPLASLLGRIRYRGRGPTHGRFFDMLIANGNVVLAENEREIVLGMIGKLHQIADQEPVRLESPEDFFLFEDPAYEKLAISVRVERRGDHDRLVLEHRTRALGPKSRRAFARYWIVIEPMGDVVSWLLLRAIKRRAEVRTKLAATGLSY